MYASVRWTAQSWSSAPTTSAMLSSGISGFRGLGYELREPGNGPAKLVDRFGREVDHDLFETQFSGCCDARQRSLPGIRNAHGRAESDRFPRPTGRKRQLPNHFNPGLEAFRTGA